MRGHWPNFENKLSEKAIVGSACNPKKVSIGITLWLLTARSHQMCGRILVLGCVFLVGIMQSGCIGLIVNTPAECKNAIPFTGVHDIFVWTKPAPKKVTTKAEFLKDWGNPDEIISTSENEETWIYKRKLWCGVMPVFLLPVPFLLPVCDGFDRIEFQGNEAKNLHTRHIATAGFVLIAGGGGTGGSDPDCRFPLHPNNGVDSDAANPTEQVGPQPKERGDSGQRIEKSLQPNLKWDAFPGLGEDVTYDLKIWRAKTGWSQLQQGSIVYERQGITQPSHQIEVPLELSTHYLWAVRAHFKLNDQIQITPWSHEIAAGAPDEPKYYHFWTPTSLELPQ